MTDENNKSNETKWDKNDVYLISHECIVNKDSGIVATSKQCKKPYYEMKSGKENK